jgi:hypothetical protein
MTTVDVFLRISELEIHVAINVHEIALKFVEIVFFKPETTLYSILMIFVIMLDKVVFARVIQASFLIWLSSSSGSVYMKKARMFL